MESYVEKMKKIEETFSGNPKLIQLFLQYEKDIGYYHAALWEEGTTKELLEEKRRILWELAQNIDQIDLMLLYYARVVEGVGRTRLLRALKARYKEQCAFQKDILGKETFLDISNIGRRKSLKKQKNP